PDSPFMSPSLLRKVRDLVLDGATVWGPKPQKSPSLSDYPRCDAEVRQIGDEVWGDCDGKVVKSHSIGKGKIVYGEPLAPVLDRMHAGPDFQNSGLVRGTRLAYIHRNVDGAEI